jgi:2-amino-4-hydroxy-6-hydroxymethyldihydropteridine diphosphokinase
MYHNSYLLTGGNMGNRMENLLIAAAMVEEQCGSILKKSSIYETKAWGYENQPHFLNQVILIATQLSPVLLLEKILAIEQFMGRKRETKYGPRLIDIDILLYDDEKIEAPGLSIPHPAMLQRRFVLTPLCEVASDLVHPVRKKTMQELLKDCLDELPVHKISS